MPFVLSGGQLATVGSPPPSWSTPSGVRVSEHVSLEYAAIWRTQPQVRTVTAFLARNIAQIGLHAYERVSDVDRQRLTDHPLGALLASPTPRTTQYRFLNTLVLDVSIYDVFVGVKIRPEGSLRALQRVDPRRVTPIGSNPFDPDGFEIRGQRSKREVPADQVVFLRGYNPDDARWGSPPMEALRGLLSEGYAAEQWRAQLWRNQARAAGYLRRPLEAPPWSEEAKNRFRDHWHAQYVGDGPEAGGTPILEDGMEWLSAAMKPVEAQYLEVRKLTREEVAAAYHVPLPMVGILDHATYSNIREQHKQLYQDCLGPWLQMIQQDLSLQLIPDFSGASRVYIEFNINEKLRGNFEEQAEHLTSAIGGPYMTRNEGRARLNLPQIDGGDELITPLNVIEGGQPSPRDLVDSDDSPPQLRAASRTLQVKARVSEAEEQRAVEVLDAYFRRQQRAVASRLGAQKAHGKATLLDIYSPTRWIAELTAELFTLGLSVTVRAAKAVLRLLDLDSDGYDVARTEGWIQEHAAAVAEAIETDTARDLTAALADPDPQKAIHDLFEGYATTRAPAVAVSETTALSGFGTEEAVEKSGRPATKTWRTTSGNPRASHARLNGESVPVGAEFSNGARFPGDRSLPPGERLGCRCEMTIDLETT